MSHFEFIGNCLHHGLGQLTPGLFCCEQSRLQLDIGNRLTLFLTVAQNRTDSFALNVVLLYYLPFAIAIFERVCIQFDSCISKLQQRSMLNSSSFDG